LFMVFAFAGASPLGKSAAGATLTPALPALCLGKPAKLSAVARSRVAASCASVDGALSRGLASALQLASVASKSGQPDFASAQRMKSNLRINRDLKERVKPTSSEALSFCAAKISRRAALLGLTKSRPAQAGRTLSKQAVTSKGRVEEDLRLEAIGLRSDGQQHYALLLSTLSRLLSRRQACYELFEQ
jgi:hypothetical protein